MITALRTLAAAGFDALAQFTTPVADAIWDEAHRRPAAEVTLLDEIADHAAAIRHLLEDIRNLIASGAGHPNPCLCAETFVRTGVLLKCVVCDREATT